MRTRKQTFTAYVDIRQNDKIDRRLLWSKLSAYGVNGKMMKTLKSLYSNVQYSVKVNHYKTYTFYAKCGLKQGCLLSTLAFNLYINDVSHSFNASNVGIDIDDKLINHLFYADDLVLIAESKI